MPVVVGKAPQGAASADHSELMGAAGDPTIPATLIVTIDTEEEGLWTGRFPRSGNTVRNIYEIERFQLLCDNFGILPTYLIDAPVVDDDRSVAILRTILEDGRCEVGSHIHPWCNPPFEEEITSRTSYLCNLPEPLQRAKLTWLTDRIEQRIGRRPTSFRAGRYGLDIVGARILASLGYVVDSSVIPFTTYADEGGPDFSNAPTKPYFIASDNMLVPHNTGFLLEVPVAAGYSRLDFDRCQALREAAERTCFRHIRAVGILDRLGLAHRIRFCPEQSGAGDMARLADNCLARKAPAMVLMFHSSSLLPGGSPYVPTAGHVDRFLGKLRAVFHHCLNVRGMRTTTLTDFASETSPTHERC